jgi:hypothetical protein
MTDLGDLDVTKVMILHTFAADDPRFSSDLDKMLLKQGRANACDHQSQDCERSKNAEQSVFAKTSPAFHCDLSGLQFCERLVSPANSLIADGDRLFARRT